MGINRNDPLLKADIEYLEALIADGILKPMDEKLFPGRNGIQIIRCGDGDQDGHIMAAHRSVCTGRDCHHQFALNGLPIRIPPQSPLYDPAFAVDQLICNEVLGACGLKDLKESIALYPHWPCGAGYQAQLPLWEQMRICAETKRILLEFLKKNGHGNMVIVLGMHLDLWYREPREKVLLNWNRHAWANWHRGKFPDRHNIDAIAKVA